MTRNTCMWFKLATWINISTGRQQKTVSLTGCLAVENCHIFEQHQLSHFIYEMTAEQKLSVFFSFWQKDMALQSLKEEQKDIIRITTVKATQDRYPLQHARLRKSKTQMTPLQIVPAVLTPGFLKCDWLTPFVVFHITLTKIWTRKEHLEILALEFSPRCFACRFETFLSAH